MASATMLQAHCSPDSLAAMAVDALYQEVLLTPKPGLIDQNNTGSHKDMNLTLMVTSATALYEPLRKCAQVAIDLPWGVQLRTELGKIGRAGELHMLTVTGGINTHRGALWSLGLLSAAATQTMTLDGLLDYAAQLAQVPDIDQQIVQDRESHGMQVRRKYGIGGARQEACAGFPHIINYALPALLTARAQGISERDCQILALLTLMATVDDTCVLYRGGYTGLQLVQQQAQIALTLGGTCTSEGMQYLEHMDGIFCQHYLSPGGSADLLAATIFLDSLLTAKFLFYDSPGDD